MKLTKTGPNYFANIIPWNSIFQKNEYEITAWHIMHLLAATGNVFRPLTFKEYKQKYSGADEERFNDVIKYCKNSDTAQLFSPSWKINI